MALNVPQAVQIAFRWHCGKANTSTSTRPGTTLVRSASRITGQNLSLFDFELRASAISVYITSRPKEKIAVGGLSRHTRTGGDYEEAVQKKSRPPSSITPLGCELLPVFEYINSEKPMS